MVILSFIQVSFLYFPDVGTYTNKKLARTNEVAADNINPFLIPALLNIPILELKTEVVDGSKAFG